MMSKRVDLGLASEGIPAGASNRVSQNAICPTYPAFRGRGPTLASRPRRSRPRRSRPTWRSGRPRRRGLHLPRSSHRDPRGRGLRSNEERPSEAGPLARARFRPCSIPVVMRVSVAVPCTRAVTGSAAPIAFPWLIGGTPDRHPMAMRLGCGPMARAGFRPCSIPLVIRAAAVVVASARAHVVRCRPLARAALQ